MITDGLGATIVDMLTTSPSLSGIGSASALLDTSNYCIQAAAFGKDPEGYRQHAHEVSAPGSMATDQIIRVYSYEGLEISSYHTSATNAQKTNYKLWPELPNPEQTRLIRGSTGTHVTALEIDFPADSSSYFDIGHNSNTIGNQAGTFDAINTKVGCYAASGGTTWRMYSASDPATLIVSGVVSGAYNWHKIMDSSGFYRRAPNDCIFHRIAINDGIYTSGFLVNGTNASATGSVAHTLMVSAGDAAVALLFGGIYSVGLYTIDIKKNLGEGRTPPYHFSFPDNNIRYRLVGVKTFLRDLLYLKDVEVPPLSGFKTAFEGGAPAGNVFFIWDFAFV